MCLAFSQNCTDLPFVRIVRMGVGGGGGGGGGREGGQEEGGGGEGRSSTTLVS